MFGSHGYASRGVLIFAAAVCFNAAIVYAQNSQDELPNGRGKSQFTRICSQCHALQVATKQRNTEDGWTGVVNEMVSRGAQGTDDEFDLVVRYLTAHYGVNDPAGDTKKAAPSKVNINQASEKDISTLLGMKEADAQAIVHYRENTGSFNDWHDLEKVPDIDLKKLADQKDRIEYAKASEPAKDSKQ